MSFKIGEKVVCVDDSFSVKCRFCVSSLPKKGRVYVVSGVRWVDAERSVSGRSGWSLFLVGIETTMRTHLGEDRSFAAWRFRNLSEIQSENKASRKNLLKIEASKLGHSLIFV